MAVLNALHEIGVVQPGKFVARDFGFFDDFLECGYGTTVGYKFASTANAGQWLYTELGGATSTFIISDAEPGGVLAMSDGGTTNHGTNAQLNGEAFEITAGKDIRFEMRWKPSHATRLDFVFGLCNTSTAIIAGTVSQAIVFRSGAVDTSPDNAGVADIICSVGDDITSWTHANITEADTGVNMVADTYVVTSFWLEWISATTAHVHFYVNGSEVFKATSNIPDIGTALTLTLCRQNNGGAANVEIDYIYCVQQR